MGKKGLKRAKILLAMIAAAGCLGATAARVRAEVVVRQHLDAGRVQFSGMDINGDDIADSIRLDRIKQSLFYFAGSEKGNFLGFDPASLPEEDRRFVPDVLIEKDLDGDEIEDLLLLNRAYLEKYLDREAPFRRILAQGIYIGQPQGHYKSLRLAVPSPEAREAILEEARKILFPEP